MKNMRYRGEPLTMLTSKYKKIPKLVNNGKPKIWWGCK